MKLQHIITHLTWSLVEKDDRICAAKGLLVKMKEKNL